MSKNEEKRGVDLLTASPEGYKSLVTIECKFDRRVQETGNYFLELGTKQANGIVKNTGIRKQYEGESPTWLIYGSEEKLLILELHKLLPKIKEWEEEKTFRTMFG